MTFAISIPSLRRVGIAVIYLLFAAKKKNTYTRLCFCLSKRFGFYLRTQKHAPRHVFAPPTGGSCCSNPTRCLPQKRRTPTRAYASAYPNDLDSTRALKNMPPACFCPAYGRVVLFESHPLFAAKKKNTYTRLCFCLSKRFGFYPRTQKHAPSMFLPRLRAGRAVRILTRCLPQKRRTPTFGWCSSFLAERVGFEPTDGFTRQTISSFYFGTLLLFR